MNYGTLIDFDCLIRIHADPSSSVADFVEFVQSRTYGNTKLSLVENEEYDHETFKYRKALELKEKGKEIRIVSSKQFYELA